MKKFFELSEEEKSRANEINKRTVFINACDSTFVPGFREEYFPKLINSMKPCYHSFLLDCLGEKKVQDTLVVLD